MRLQDYEITIKDKIKLNKEDESIYEDLQKMIDMFLRRKKVCNCWKDYDDLSHQMAADIFMKIVNGEEFSYLLGYLEKVYRSYAHIYYDENGSDRIYLDEMPCDQIRGHSTTYQYRMVDNKIYLEEIFRVVDEVMDSSCKYDPSSCSFINLKLSLILSLIRKETVSFHINKEQEFYLKLIITNFYSRVVKDGLDFNDNEVRE